MPDADFAEVLLDDRPAYLAFFASLLHDRLIDEIQRAKIILASEKFTRKHAHYWSKSMGQPNDSVQSDHLLTRRSFVNYGSRLAATFALGCAAPLLDGCGSGGGAPASGGSNSGSGLSAVTLNIKRSAGGPPVNSLMVMVGGGVSGSPNANGVLTLSAPIGGTFTTLVIVTDPTSNQAVLLAVVPAGTSIANVDEQSTIQALLFLRFLSPVFPQSQHAAFVALLTAVPQVSAAVTTFEQSYQTNGLALTSLSQMPDLLSAIQAAITAVATVVGSSPFFTKGGQAIFGAQSPTKLVSRTVSIAPLPSANQMLSFVVANGSIEAQNSAQMFRWAGITDSQNNTMGSIILPDASFQPASVTNTTLDPATLPYQSTLNLVVTGGLSNSTSYDTVHAVPLAMTLAFRIMIPYFYTVLGLAVPTSFNTSSVSINSTVATGSAALDAVINGFGWSSAPANPSPMPAIALLQNMASGSSSSVDVLTMLDIWFVKSFLPTVTSQLTSLAGGISSSYFSTSTQYVVNALSAVNAIMLALMAGTSLPPGMLTIPASGMDLLNVPYTSDFTVSQTGSITATIE